MDRRKMENSKSKSFFREIRARELNAFQVRKRPYFGETGPRFVEIGAVSVERNGNGTPPMAVSFCKSTASSHIFALSDEDGCVSLFDTRRKLPSFKSHRENREKLRISEWIAHQNAIFDVCWIKDDTHILTASGDQTIKVWDVQEEKCTGVLMGHTASVKSLCAHPTNSDLIVSGSRDGSFAIWDLRCKITPKNRRDKTCITSTSMVKKAHLPPQAKRLRQGKAASMSITSVLYLKDEISIATAGAVESIIKFWDTRNLKAQVTQATPYLNSSTQQPKGLHGISSLSQDLNGVLLTCSCMDNRIYLYNVLRLEDGPVQSFSGCQIGSFFVKSAISPDAAHILSGSSDGNGYIWQVDKLDMEPILLRGHDREVTAVDWCQSEVGRIVTTSDDFTARVWNIQSSYSSTTRSPSSAQRRVMAVPSVDCRKFLMDEPKGTKGLENLQSPDEALQVNSSSPITVPTISTPEAQEKKFSSGPNLTEIVEKTPEADMKSPSSVLNPPSSIKRKTILDYFFAA